MSYIPIFWQGVVWAIGTEFLIFIIVVSYLAVSDEIAARMKRKEAQ